MPECWRVTSRHEGYEVSDQGRVRNRLTGRILKPVTNSRGYLNVALIQGRRPGPGLRPYVHQLVAEAFVPGRTPGDTVDHIDWDKRNNTVANLRWMPLDLNSVRWWKARTPEGRNVWANREDDAEQIEPLPADELADALAPWSP